MSSNCFQRLCTLAVFLALTITTFQIAWQGTGNMNETVMTEIHSQIDSHPLTSSTADLTFEQTAKNISTSLNKLWDPAWNVMVIKSAKPLDTILYGYAFRNHWMWICGNSISATSNASVDYIIWKDYNCQNWTTMVDMTTAGTSFSTNQISQISSYTFSKVGTDVWLEAHSLAEHVNAQSLLSSGAYTIVMSQNTSARYFGYICVVNTNYHGKRNLVTVNSKPYGSYFIFQTR